MYTYIYPIECLLYPNNFRHTRTVVTKVTEDAYLELGQVRLRPRVVVLKEGS